MDSNTKRKIIYFIAVLALYCVAAGADIGSILCWRTTRLYVIAAIFAFWVGGEPFGVYHKMTARPLYIWVGTFMMVCMFILMLLLKEALHHYDHAPLK